MAMAKYLTWSDGWKPDNGMSNLTYSLLRCGRCGCRYHSSLCPHTNTEVPDMSDEEADRVIARYALGKRFNPDHDQTSYRDGNDD